MLSETGILISAVMMLGEEKFTKLHASKFMLVKVSGVFSP
jgi:hypothetical protein